MNLGSVNLVAVKKKQNTKKTKKNQTIQKFSEIKNSPYTLIMQVLILTIHSLLAPAESDPVLVLRCFSAIHVNGNQTRGQGSTSPATCQGQCELPKGQERAALNHPDSLEPELLTCLLESVPLGAAPVRAGWAAARHRAARRAPAPAHRPRGMLRAARGWG